MQNPPFKSKILPSVAYHHQKNLPGPAADGKVCNQSNQLDGKSIQNQSMEKYMEKYSKIRTWKERGMERSERAQNLTHLLLTQYRRCEATISVDAKTLGLAGQPTPHNLSDSFSAFPNQNKSVTIGSSGRLS